MIGRVKVMKRPQAILLAVLLLIVAGYGIFTYYSVWSQRASDSTAPTHMFDATTARAGDVIVGMEIAINDTQLLAPFGPSGIVQFSGRATVSGVYRVVVDADPRTWVQFHVDEESIGKLPRMKGDTDRDVWFVFNNQDKALDAFGAIAKSGRATIAIDNYRIHRAETDAFNTADLVRVIRVD